MTEKQKYASLIKRQMKMQNIDSKPYKPLIESLADILVERQAAYQKYMDEGAQLMIEYTNKSGATNIVKNPILTIWTDLNHQALEHWRELGLTPSAFRKMTGDKPQKQKASGLAEALASIEG